MLPFRKRLTFDQRRAERDRVMHMCRERVPVIAEVGSRETPRSDKEKFLVPRDLTISQFLFVLRKRIRLAAKDSLFLLVNETMVPASTTMRELYERHVEPDGFLYITYTIENTFG